MIFLSAFDSILESTFKFKTCILILGLSLIVGVLFALTYCLKKKKEGYTKDFPITLLLLPMVVSVIIYFVRDNIAGGISLAGIFALTRFRSEQRNTEDITYLFLSVALGLVIGLGYVLAAAILTVLFLLIIVLLSLFHFGEGSKKEMTLKILVPEDLNYDEVFDEVLARFCDTYYLKRVKTCDFGTMFELTYHVRMKNMKEQKALMDELRTRNGNLNITLTVHRYEQ